MSLSAHMPPFKAPSIKKGGGNCLGGEEARAAPRLGSALEESWAGRKRSCSAEHWAKGYAEPFSPGKSFHSCFSPEESKLSGQCSGHHCGF